LTAVSGLSSQVLLPTYAARYDSPSLTFPYPVLTTRIDATSTVLFPPLVLSLHGFSIPAPKYLRRAMSTSESLSDHLSNLSLAVNTPLPDDNSLSSSAESTFILVCSDGKRVSVDVDSLGLASSVFGDLLEMGSGQRECEISESSTEIGLFLVSLNKHRRPSSENEWITLYEMMDKYDCSGLRITLLASIRCAVVVFFFVDCFI
jgi:hypothetical protein